ncbi:hypothetical protein MMC12_001312 [Toensbergia leucococca]|nr:hypothetical protein [Toensbergia leucococca]
MPLWRIFSHPSTFTIDQKQALGESITSLYTTSHLPGFYVNVIFIPVEAENFYIAGKPVTDYVRIAIEHIAIHRPIEVRASMCAEIDKLLAPHIAARGDLRWEYHINDTPRDLWKIQGMVPPPWKSAEEKVWAEKGVALAWEDGELKGKM